MRFAVLTSIGVAVALGLVVVVVGGVRPARAAEGEGGAKFDASKLPPAASRKVDFVKDVQPIFAAHCTQCHGPAKQKGGFRFDAKASAFKEGSHGPAVKPGDSAGSLLVRAVSRLDPKLQMPAEGEPLSAEQVGVLRAWIDQGAEWPDSASVSLDAPKADEHWAFKPVTRPSVPAVGNAAWVRNPIDAFVLTRLEHEKLTPSPEADRRTLIRRLSFDLIGLPPTPDEVDAFVADKSPEAYEKLVDRLLASPRYGERWARHWLDVVRFADSFGFERNSPRPNAWRYRDYVIRSFNDDKPYDQFIREQIAGDFFGAEEGTGFLVGGPADQVKGKDPALAAQQRADELNDMVATTGTAILGLTVGCARCHDHKFDPVTHVDYHRLKAVFAGVKHADRAVKLPMQVSPDTTEMTTALKSRLREIDAALEAYEPLANPAARFMLVTAEPEDSKTTTVLAALFVQPTKPAAAAADADDDENDDAPAAAAAAVTDAKSKAKSKTTAMTKPAAVPETTAAKMPAATKTGYGGGADRGRLEDPGSATHLPTFGRGFLSWKKVANQDVFAWTPGAAAGRYRVWLSWGCGRSGHAGDVTYSLDADGDLATTNDRTTIAHADQRRFAGGGGPVAVAPLWSGFLDAGVHAVTPASRIVLTGDSMAKSTVTADAALLEAVADDVNGPAAKPFPAMRDAIRASGNIDRFAGIAARFIRFTSLETAGGVAPALDHVEVFAPGDQLKHVATADSPEFAGNAFIVELARETTIDRVVWGRSADAKSVDGLPIRYRIEVATTPGGPWTLVATDGDRMPYDPAAKAVPEPVRAVPPGGSAGAAQALDTLLDERVWIVARMKSLRGPAPAYVGTFDKEPAPIFRLNRGEPSQPREQVNPGAPVSIGAPPLDLPADAPEQQRRVRLAEWLTNPANPLPARVMANRLWHYHFGHGIVATPSDFGHMGFKPTHPELLDWLASELVSGDGWRLKHLHKLIVMSATYRQSSDFRPDAAAADAGSALLWRMPPRRLEAEALRDTVLAVSGKLNLAMGGPGFSPFVPDGNFVSVYEPRDDFGPVEWRRMVYQAKPRIHQDGTFGAFDCPDGAQIAPKRTSSTTPLQALNLLNSPFMVQQADFLAARVRREAGTNADTNAQVMSLFRLAYNRTPTDAEREEFSGFAKQFGMAALCRVALNANEFLYVY